ARLLHLFELLETRDRFADRGEVGQRAAEPPLVDVEAATASGLLQHGVLGLLLGADEQQAAAAGGQLAYEGVRLAELLQGLLQIDDVDPVALAEDVLLHLRIPSLRLVAEVHPGLEQFLHCQCGHSSSFGWFLRRAPTPLGRRPNRARRAW